MAEPRSVIEALLRGRVPRSDVDPALRAVVEAASPGLALLDAAGRLVAWNAELARLCGPTLPLRAGMRLELLVDPAQRDGLAASLEAGRKLEVGLASAGTPVVQIERRPLPLREPASLLRVAPLMQAELSAQNAAAARLQAVGALAGGIAHDFNNLLSAIAGSAEAALERDGADPAGPELRQILESAARGAALVRQLLAFARQQALHPRVVELNDAVNAMVGLLRRLLGSQVRLTVQLDEPGRRVRIDPTQLDQVIMNLALNARDAMPQGGSLHIVTSHAVVLQPEPLGQDELPPGRYAILEVADTGGGIPPEILPRIFDPFFTTKREQGGNGLGLSTVHGIVRQSGGFIAAESHRGQGTTFRIWLPRHEGRAAPPQPALPGGLAAELASQMAPEPATRAAPLGAPSPPQPAGDGPPVLLVEDEPPLLRLAARALRGAGFTVLTAASAEEALDLLDAGAPAPCALVSDVVMPGLDGLALAARLRARQPGLPVLLVSGYAEAALGRDLASEGLRLLPKPYALADLVMELRALLPALSVLPIPPKSTEVS
jgi:two-component system cell cycle sensor histidine kinase/response regulator CckA